MNATLEAWLKQNIAMGCAPQAMVDSMVASGHKLDYAQVTVATAFAKYRPDALAPLMQSPEGREALQVLKAHADESMQPYTGPSKAAPILDPARVKSNLITLKDKTIEVLLVSQSPRVVMFDNFLSEDECEALVALSQGKLDRSLTVDAATGKSTEHAARTSYGTYFRKGENPLVSHIEDRIAALLAWPVSHGEDLQILHYKVGGEYLPHFDYFDPVLSGSDIHTQRGGQRIATFLMYLNHVEAGGGTIFPATGLETRPKRGSAVYFAYQNPDGSPDATSLHGGSPVLAGEKWIATKWLREYPFA